MADRRWAEFGEDGSDASSYTRQPNPAEIQCSATLQGDCVLGSVNSNLINKKQVINPKQQSI